MAIDHGAAEFEIAHAAFQLVGGGLRVLHGKMREAGIAVGTFLNFLGEKIVRRTGVAHRGRGIRLHLHAGTGNRQHGAGDARLIHHLQPLLAEIGERRI